MTETTPALPEGRLEIRKAFAFEAAHFFSHMPEGHRNRRIHGHSFRVEVALEGKTDPETGWVANFDALEEDLKGVQGLLDHRLLNEIPGLEQPSLEHLARWISRQLILRYPGLVSVTVSRPSCQEQAIFHLKSAR